jgi:hypothetical protein
MLKLFNSKLIVLNCIYDKYKELVKPPLLKALTSEQTPVDLKVSIGAALQTQSEFLEEHLCERQRVAT